MSGNCGRAQALLMTFWAELASTYREVLALNKAAEDAPALTISLAVVLRLYAFLYPPLSQGASSGRAGAMIAVSTRGDVRSLASDWTSIPENMESANFVLKISGPSLGPAQ